MPSATVTSKGQITIPVEVRTQMGLRPGSRITFVATDDGGFEIRAAGRSITEFKGVLPRPAVPVTIEEMNEAIVRGWAGEA